MATGFVEPPNIHTFTKDNASSSSNLSLYTVEAHQRFASGDFIFQPENNNSRTQTRDTSTSDPKKNRSIKPMSIGTPRKTKPIREFTVSRRNSYRGPHYYKLNKPISPTSKEHRRLSKFDTPDQIDPVFELFPKSSVLENPSYIVQYFSKTLDLIKKNPEIRYQILKAQIQPTTTVAPTKNNDYLEKKEKQRKYQSLPIMGSYVKAEEKSLLRSNQRKSAPASLPAHLTYIPTSMTMPEYLNTPLDFYTHKKKSSITSSADSKGTKATDKSYTSFKPRTKSSGSYAESISTSALSLSRNKIVEQRKEASKRNRELQTTRKDSVIRRRSRAQPQAFDSMDNYASDELKKNLSGMKREKYLSKYGTPILETNAERFLQEEEPIKYNKRDSDFGTVSIATGDEIYNEIKAKIYSKGFSNWEQVNKYLTKHHPDLADNSYFLARFMFEIYIRRVLASKIALKLGSDKSRKGTGNEVWIGLKESIAAVYGEDSAAFFETRNK